MQPRGVNGGSASKISPIVPSPNSLEGADAALEEAARAGAVVGMELEPRVDARTDQPGPHGALVIRGVARAQIAEVLRLVVRLARRERSQSHGRQQPFAATTSSTGVPAPRSSTGWSSEIASS